METLYKKLETYCSGDCYPFHMPGHKRNKKLKYQLPYGTDITEIDGFDDLHHADGILKEAQERAAGLYHAEESYFLVNGSTVGILSAILGTTRRGDKILVARNCHKSVYHAMELNELRPVYIYPEFLTSMHLNGEVSAKKIDEALRKDERIRAVMIVSPTYDGVVSDVHAIADVAHAYGLPLIVDEAHGAHFGFGTVFPQNANACGADIVIHSLHKTLPSLTQTAILHMNGKIVKRGRVRKYLHMLQSSSPSYVLMAGIDACMEFLEKESAGWFETYERMLLRTRAELAGLKHLKLLRTEHFDLSKFVISTLGCSITSTELYDMLLKEYQLQMEMKAESYVLAMTTVCDTEEGLKRLVKALFEIDEKIAAREKISEAERCSAEDVVMTGRFSMENGFPEAQVCLTVSELEELSETAFQVKRWEACEGMVSAEYAYLYPPGIPLLAPGEYVSREIISWLCAYREMGFEIEGPAEAGKLKVTGERYYE